MRIENLFMDLVKIDSPSGFEEEVGKYILDFCSKRNINLKRDNVGNLYFSNKNSKVLLTAHMDTVQKSHIEPIIFKNKIFSSTNTILGADDKASVATILKIVDLYYINKSKINFELLFTVKEELGMQGVKEFDFNKLYSKTCISFDIANNNVGSVVSKAISGFIVEIEFLGKSAHPSNPRKGINALIFAANVLSKLPIGKASKNTTLNFGIINSEGIANEIPSKIIVKGDIRTFNELEAISLKSQIEEILKKESKKLRAKYKFKMNKIINGYSLNLSSSIYKTFLEVINEIGIQENTIQTFSGSDLNIIIEKGIEGILISNGAQNVHSTDEYISIEDLEISTNILLGMLNKI